MALCNHVINVGLSHAPTSFMTGWCKLIWTRQWINWWRHFLICWL